MHRRADRDRTGDGQVPEHRAMECSLPWQESQGHRGISKAYVSLWSRKPFAGGLGRKHGKLSSPNMHRTQLSAGTGMGGVRLDAALDVLSNSTSQVLDWQRPKL